MKPTKFISYLITPQPSEAYLLTLPQILKTHCVDWIMYRDTLPMQNISFELIERFLEVVLAFEKTLILNLSFRSASEVLNTLNRLNNKSKKSFRGVHLKSHLLGLVPELREAGLGISGGQISESKGAEQNFLIGYSAHSISEVKAALDIQVSYTTLSPIFPSLGKGKALELEALTMLSPLQRHKTFALGGIDRDKLQSLKSLDMLGFAAIGYFNPFS